MANRQPAVLDVTRKPDGYRFVLARPGEPFMATRNVLDAQVTHSTVRQLCGLIGRRIEEENAGKPSSLGPNCRALLDELMSEVADPRIWKLREELRSLDSPLLIQTDDADVYWELLNHGGSESDSFLALRLDVGRSLKMQSVPPAVPRPDTPMRCLLVADPNPDEDEWALPEAAREANGLRDWLQQHGVDCADFLRGMDADEANLLDTLAHHRYDIIHYAGHVVLDPQSHQYALRLHGGRLFPSSSIRKQVKGSPLVFLNACWSSKAQGAATNAAGSIEGMTNAFLEAGAQLVVGALFGIPDIGARKFAERFYDGVLAGKPIGEAMRLARHHVLNQPDCGAAWASFVLYGDPCLKIEVRTDPLNRALQAAGLARDDFEGGCLRLIEQAFEYGLGNGGVATAHLLAAMAGSDSGRLKAVLDDKYVSPSRLRDAFKHLFKVLGGAAEESAEIAFTPNVNQILNLARELAHEEGRAKAAESHLTRAFGRHGGGKAGEVLRSMGVEVADLANEPVPPEVPAERGQATRQLVDHVGPLRRHQCSDGAWQILADAAHEAARRGHAQLSSTHLMLGLFRREHEPIRKALRRMGLDPAEIAQGLGIPQEDIAAPAPAVPKIDCTSNAAQVLRSALDNESRLDRRHVDERALLTALVASRDSAAGRFLREKLGLCVEALECGLFGAAGELLEDRLEPAAATVLRRAFACANQRRHGALSRVHLLHALLSEQEGAFGSLVRASGAEPIHLADNLCTALMPMGSADGTAVDVCLRSASMGLLRLLCACELEAGAAGEARVSISRLIKAVLVDGCGAGGQFLLSQGVNWGALKALSEHAPVESRRLH